MPPVSGPQRDPLPSVVGRIREEDLCCCGEFQRRDGSDPLARVRLCLRAVLFRERRVDDLLDRFGGQFGLQQLDGFVELGVAAGHDGGGVLVDFDVGVGAVAFD